MVLPVAVECNQHVIVALQRILDRGLNGPPVSEVAQMSCCDDAEALHNLCGRIARTVIDYQQVEPGKKRSRLGNDTADGCLFVIGGNGDENLLGRCVGHCSIGAEIVTSVYAVLVWIRSMRSPTFFMLNTSRNLNLVAKTVSTSVINWIWRNESHASTSSAVISRVMARSFSWKTSSNTVFNFRVISSLVILVYPSRAW